MDNLENIQDQPGFEPVADAADFLPEEALYEECPVVAEPEEDNIDDFDEELPEAEAKSIETVIRKLDFVARADFVSREKALEEFIADHQDNEAFSGVEASDLRHRVEVVLKENSEIKKAIQLKKEYYEQKE